MTPTGPSTPQPYQSFFLTPGGTIVSTTGRPIKPETDPSWEERRAAAREAKRQRRSFVSLTVFIKLSPNRSEKFRESRYMIDFCGVPPKFLRNFFSENPTQISEKNSRKSDLGQRMALNPTWGIRIQRIWKRTWIQANTLCI